MVPFEDLRASTAREQHDVAAAVGFRAGLAQHDADFLQEVVVKGIDVAQIVARGAGAGAIQALLPSSGLVLLSASAFGRPPLPNTSVV